MAEEDSQSTETGANGQAGPGVGEQLRAARHRQGLSLADLATRLRLTEDQVAALEEEDFGYLHGDTFVRGYLRNYARSLELDPEAIIAAYEQSGPAPVGTEETPLVPPAERPILEHPWRVAIVSLVLVLLVAGGVLALVATDIVKLGGGVGEMPRQETSQGKTDNNASPTEGEGGEEGQAPEESAAEDAPAEGPEGEALFTDEPPDAFGPAGESDDAEVPGTGLTPTDERAADPDEMRLRTWEKAWLQVTDARGRVLLRRLVDKGKELHLYGQAPFRARVGNAAGVQLYFKDDPLPPLGGIGEVVTRTVGPDSETIPEEEVGPPEVLVEARRKGLPTTGDGPPPEADEGGDGAPQEEVGPTGAPAPDDANGPEGD